MDPSAWPERNPVPSLFDARDTTYESVLYKVEALLFLMNDALIFPSANPTTNGP